MNERIKTEKAMQSAQPVEPMQAALQALESAAFADVFTTETTSPLNPGFRLRTRPEVIAYCLTLPGAYEDYPFHDPTWTVMRHRDSRKSFAFICEREGRIWVNVKCDPEWILLWRGTYKSVVPAYHMNKKYWNSLILDGTIPDREIKRMIAESYDLTVQKSYQSYRK